MGSPYLCEIRIFSFKYAPRGWAFCNGQILPIQQNQAMFSLLGTTYGGNGTVNFALPNLQGRMAYHPGTNDGNTMVIGETGGEATHTLLLPEIPVHNHLAYASPAQPDSSTPASSYWCAQPANSYGTTAGGTMSPTAIGTIGGSQPHPNEHPYLVLNFCIAISGIFPSRG